MWSWMPETVYEPSGNSNSSFYIGAIFFKSFIVIPFPDILPCVMNWYIF